jgi:hypothetical protein
MPFDFFRLQTEALNRLSVPPVPSDVERPEVHGDLVASFALPLELCEPQNRKRHATIWKSDSKRKKLRELMFLQCNPTRSPLTGRPQVLCVRFSSHEPDPMSDWAKMAVDVLQVATKSAPVGRLGLIRDDTRRAIDQHQWWERAKPGQGFVYMEVRTGKSVAA